MSSESSEVKCPTCGGTGREDEGNCGYNGRCRQCNGKGTVPAPPASDEAKGR
jgi:DnaJ-class molecular chaperone